MLKRFRIHQAFLILSLPILPIAWSGCVVLAVGAGAAGGYAVCNDSIEGIKDVAFDKAWDAAMEVLSTQGVIQEQFKDQGRIVAKVDGSTVRFELQQPTPKSILMRVKARRLSNMFPDMRTAQQVYSMISSEAR